MQSTRPLSEYNKFVKENIPKIRVANPELNARDVMKKCAEEWKLSKSTRASQPAMESEKKPEVMKTKIKKRLVSVYGG